MASLMEPIPIAPSGRLTPPIIVIESPSESSGASDGESSQPPSPIIHRTVQERKADTFARLVRAVKFIKIWTVKTEQESAASSSQDPKIQFLERFKLSGPVRRKRKKEEPKLKKGGFCGCRKQKFILNPTGNALYRWLAILTIAVLYNSFLIIVRETFTQLQDNYQTLWLILDYTADAIYLIDVVIQFFTSYLEKGLLVTDFRLLALHYMKSLHFKLDVISIIPFDLLYFIPEIGVARVIVRLNRLFRLHRMILFFDRTESRTNYPNMFRVFILVLYITLIIHWNACIYYFISERIGFGTDTWVYPSLLDEVGNRTVFASLSRQYLFSFYWSTLTLTTIGELPGPQTNWEFTFVILDFLVGVLIFATIVGMVGGIITNMNIRRMNFQGQLDSIKQYMSYRTVGKDLQIRVIKWFEYLWNNNHTLNESEILQYLPDKLKTEIAIHVHFDTLRQVEIFKECEAGLLEELVLKLKPQVYSPGDYICRKGDIGKEMYIIKQGHLEVIGNHPNHVIATLTEGGYFGEIGLLNLGDNRNRRTASVRSVGYSSLFCLSKNDLLEALWEYPEAKALLEERGRSTLIRDGTLHPNAPFISSPFRHDGVVDRAVVERLHQKIEKLEVNFQRLHNRFKRLSIEYNLRARNQ